MNTGNIIVNDNTQYIIYVLEMYDWDKITLYNKNSSIIYLTSKCYFEINKHDIIIIYIVGAGKKCGFCWYGQAGGTFEQTNGEHPIHNDVNKNIFSISINTHIYLTTPVKLSDIENNLKQYADFKSTGAFRKKYFSVKNSFKIMNNEIGLELFKSLCINNNLINDSYNNVAKKKLPKIDDLYDEDDTYDNISDNGKTTDDNKENIIDDDITDDITDDDITDDVIIDDDITDDNKGNTIKKKKSYPIIVNKEPIDINGVINKIPILLNPCKKFKLNKNTTKYNILTATFQPNEKKLIDEIMCHYLTCDKCEITNNNNSELKEIIDNNMTKYSIDIIDCEDGELLNMMDAYHNLMKYRICTPKCQMNLVPCMRILVIDDTNDKYYNNCVLIGWNMIDSTYKK